MKIILKNLLYFVVFAALAGFFLEAVLSLAGNVYKWYRLPYSVGKLNLTKNTVKILCIGDSFTFGIGAGKGNSYPEQLEKLLNGRSGEKKYFVTNAGVPGLNSSQIAGGLQGNITRYAPDILIVMTFNGNDFNNLESNNFVLFDKTQGLSWFRVKSFLSHSRLFKLILMLHEKTVLLYYDFNNPAVKAKPGLPENVRAHLQKGFAFEGSGHFSDAVIEYQKAVLAAPDNEDAFVSLLRSKMFLSSLQDKLALIQQALGIFPENRALLAMSWKIYYKIGDRNHARELLLRLLKLYPAERPKFLYLLEAGFPEFPGDVVLQKLRIYNLESIIKTAERNNVKLVLMNYPNEDISFARKIAAQKAIPFIDNKSAFEKVNTNVAAGNELFVEDHHCTNKGYAVIAANVQESLKFFKVLQ